jgi:hypothetical protein
MNLCPITLREANAFVGSFHRHNEPVQRNGGKFAIGIEDGDNLVAVAIVGRPIARLLNDDYTAEILRVCTLPDAPRNCCSMLYGACWRAWRSMGGRRIVTYTLQTESGSSLRGAGFALIAQLGPRTWSWKGRHRNWQPVYGQQKFRWEKIEYEDQLHA